LKLPYGSRHAMIKGPCGNDWQIATRKRSKDHAG